MSHTIKLSVLIYILGIASSYAQFKHPGILHDHDELYFIKDKIEEKEDPWYSEFLKLKNSKLGSLSWESSPVSTINVGYHGKPKIGEEEFARDGDAAYTHSLLWFFTGDTAYAYKSAQIIHAWSTHLNDVVNKNTKLIISMSTIKYLVAAEILKHSSSIWSVDDQQKFETLISDLLYTKIAGFAPFYNGNWDAALMQTIMAMGIYLDDLPMFISACNQFLSGKSYGAIDNYINEYGQCQESGRDQIHVQMGLGYLGMACEIAWKQGIDLYSSYENRLLKGYEYTARYLLGYPVSYQQFKGFDGKLFFGKEISDEGRNRIFPIYSRVYRHYTAQKALKMPNVAELLDKEYDKNFGGAFIPWSALFQGDHGQK